jgi:hypothetical protein
MLATGRIVGRLGLKPLQQASIMGSREFAFNTKVKACVHALLTRLKAERVPTARD